MLFLTTAGFVPFVFAQTKTSNDQTPARCRSSLKNDTLPDQERPKVLLVIGDGTEPPASDGRSSRPLPASHSLRTGEKDISPWMKTFTEMILQYVKGDPQ